MTADFGGFGEVRHLSITFSLYCFEFHKKTLFFTVLNMSNFVLTKQDSREVLVFWFNEKKSAAEVHRMFVEVYGDNAPTDKSCRVWFRRFKNSEFRVEDEPRCGQPKKFEDKELEALLDKDPTQTQGELADTLRVTEQAVSVRLKSMGMIQKQGNWVPYELKLRNYDFTAC